MPATWRGWISPIGHHPLPSWHLVEDYHRKPSCQPVHTVLSAVVRSAHASSNGWWWLIASTPRPPRVSSVRIVVSAAVVAGSSIAVISVADQVTRPLDQCTCKAGTLELPVGNLVGAAAEEIVGQPDSMGGAWTVSPRPRRPRKGSAMILPRVHRAVTTWRGDWKSIATAPSRAGRGCPACTTSRASGVVVPSIRSGVTRPLASRTAAASVHAPTSMARTGLGMPPMIAGRFSTRNVSDVGLTT